MVWEQALGSQALTGDALAARSALRPWPMALLVVGSLFMLVDFWWLLNGAPAPRYKGQLLALLGGNTWLAPGIAVLGPMCVLAGAYGLRASISGVGARITSTLKTAMIVFVMLLVVAILSRPPLARIDVAGRGFDIMGGIRHHQHAGRPSVVFADDMRSLYVHTDKCRDYRARLLVTPTGDTMKIDFIDRPDPSTCPHEGTLKVIRDLSTVRSWQMQWGRDDVIELHADTVFELLE